MGSQHVAVIESQDRVQCNSCARTIASGDMCYCPECSDAAAYEEAVQAKAEVESTGEMAGRLVRVLADRGRLLGTLMPAVVEELERIAEELESAP